MHIYGWRGTCAFDGNLSMFLYPTGWSGNRCDRLAMESYSCDEGMHMIYVHVYTAYMKFAIQHTMQLLHVYL